MLVELWYSFEVLKHFYFKLLYSITFSRKYYTLTSLHVFYSLVTISFVDAGI